ncbi:predicted protein [Ostreococcus lucimarinus CCE9901]|uniref:Uncharacterized protein n=1 Tax=Ostreococcus lucimarinus (strain CCE9901) TaxID=436017 RepID=A4S404_OSTLU|nr:predicted protein [Ostreococcus lucimarinus CCE9901]ABO98477.1 predicted protein [Ostreococcus lucimarinus CCE9901]|eukprot:XP_001420184.1 predicted protein [Ostreococcus lucimarinus CCE9901]
MSLSSPRVRRSADLSRQRRPLNRRFERRVAVEFRVPSLDERFVRAAPGLT